MFCSSALFEVFRFSVKAFGFCSTAGMAFLLVLQWRQEKLTSLEKVTVQEPL